MVEDRSGLVRVAVAHNLALLVNCFETDEKYAQVTDQAIPSYTFYAHTYALGRGALPSPFVGL